MSTQDSPFVKTAFDMIPNEGAKKETNPQKNTDISYSLVEIIKQYKSLLMKVVIIVLILIIVYYVFTNFNLGCNDSFLQPQPKTGPEIQSTLDVEGKIALFNKMQETYFKA